jgi:hypothetical protein
MFGGSSLRLLSLIAVTVSFACVLAACGDDAEDGGDGPPRQTFAYANEPPQNFAQRMAKLLQTAKTLKDCRQIEEINGRSAIGLPCPAQKQLRDSMARFKLVGAQTYGTGAVVDYKSGDASDGAAILLIVAPSRNWGISRIGLATKPSTQTSDSKSRKGFDEIVDTYLRAVRERDCKAFHKVVYTGIDDRKAACKAALPATAPLAQRLKANPAVKPVYRGGNATYGFYTVETPKPEPQNSTISVVKSGTGADVDYFVLNVAPSPTAASQRAAVRKLKEQMKDGGPGMKPSDDAEPSEPANE